VQAGVLKAGIAPATVCSFVDVNINSQLNRFGVHNGGAQDAGLLNEKWEGLALLPVSGRDDKPDPNDEYYLFVASDNDFITQNGRTTPCAVAPWGTCLPNGRLYWLRPDTVQRRVGLQPCKPDPRV